MNKTILVFGLLAGSLTTASAEDLNSRFMNAFNDTPAANGTDAPAASETAAPSVVAAVVPKPRLRPAHKPETLTSDAAGALQPVSSPPLPVPRPANIR